MRAKSNRTAGQNLTASTGDSPFRLVYLCGFPFSFHDLPPLPHHVRVQDITSRYIYSQHGLQQPIYVLPLFLRRREGEIHEQALARDADRVQHEEGVVSQPRQGSRDSLADGCFPHEEPVTNNFCDPPCCNDPCKRDRTRSRTRCRAAVYIGSKNDLGEHLKHDPNDQDARSNLHCRRQRAGADKTNQSMDDL